MSNVLILGANGSVARYAIDLFLKERIVQRLALTRDDQQRFDTAFSALNAPRHRT